MVNVGYVLPMYGMLTTEKLKASLVCHYVVLLVCRCNLCSMKYFIIKRIWTTWSLFEVHWDIPIFKWKWALLIKLVDMGISNFLLLLWATLPNQKLLIYIKPIYYDILFTPQFCIETWINIFLMMWVKF